MCSTKHSPGMLLETFKREKDDRCYLMCYFKDVVMFWRFSYVVHLLRDVAFHDYEMCHDLCHCSFILTFTLFLIICVCINCQQSTSYVHPRWHPWNRFLLYSSGKRLYAFWVFKQHYRVVIIYILIRAHDNSYLFEYLLWIGSTCCQNL